MTPAPSRRKHLKSRNGCIQCKKRKIKCDENGKVPCAQCVKSRHDCSFAPPQPVVDSNFSPGALLDLKLLHNFTTKTSQTLSSTSDVRLCFSTSFVELAMQHEFLLHCILAISAFHIVSQREHGDTSQPPIGDHPREVYLQAAYKHHESALKSYRQSLSSVTSANCHGIFGCSVLLFITTFARPAESALSPGPSRATQIDVWLGFHLSEWVILIQGLPSIVGYSEFRAALSNGPLAPLMSAGDRARANTETSESPHKEAVLLNLRHLSDGIHHLSSDERIIQICSTAIETLHHVITELHHSNDHALAFIWPIRVPSEYFDLLKARIPEALSVFAHYCAILYITSSTWWTKGWPRPILESIKETIDTKWSPLLQWPMDMVFRGPESIGTVLLPVPVLPAPTMYGPRSI
ncbi:unnamed protein product [Penicillium salamii]|uniref:Zn(2)-C6 fungal-type domain-containing protein n=1 Tax=Penicillium salamii TaxID=1612424 RepID=A0A9W4IMU1_9EURO|nr:unnamed protein product [Penicillium salamii]CAG8093355.1 unnamed protein product [Penicillium salamii]CAG8252083.1 unnamed protein product [Penicillium salamii]CAG8252744.1 unnamed protein product [Penicillium salamii]CAG8304433.1 unnamed protein product [Penicillium salamii]